MIIRDEHLYHGAALNQIAEDERFTAINTLKVSGKASRSAFRVNDDIAVYLKYCKSPRGGYDEYKFTFNQTHLDELSEINLANNKLFIALVCVDAREICCLPYHDLVELIQERRKESQQDEKQYQVLITIKDNRSFRVYINYPGAQGTTLGKSIIPRNNFPKKLFE